MPIFAGAGLGLSLIVAIGAQNVFVLRQGIRREHVLLVAAICAISDAILIAVGVSGVGAATLTWPWLLPVVRWGGAAFLVAYAALAAKRAWRPSGEVLGVEPQPGASPAPMGRGVATAVRTAPASALAVATTCLALTWLNPHVYLDTVFLVGSIAGSHGERRWEFAAGAMMASLAWFFALAYGARFLGRWLSSTTAWRVLDASIAVVMLAIAMSLVAG